jgi:hypothetical protein
MSKDPGFTAVAVLTLRPGIEACTAVFSAHVVMLRPLPYGNPDRLCVLGNPFRRAPGAGLGVSYPAFNDWKDHNHVFEDLALFLRPEARR